MLIIPGTSSKELGKKIADLLKAKLIEIEHKNFPDGESYIRLKERIGRDDVIIVQTLYPQNNSLIELFFLLDLVRELGTGKVTLVIPYFAYARQHRRYLEFEVISAKTIAKIIDFFNVEKVIVIDVHDKAALKFFRAKTVNLTTSLTIANYYKNKLKNPFVLIPDQERKEFGKNIAKVLGCDYTWLKKYRDRITGKIKTKIWKDFDLKEREVLIADDIISTGETVMNAIEILKKKNAKSIFVACVHYIPSKAYEKIIKAGAKEIIATNSIQSEISKLDVAPLIAKELSKEKF